MSTAQPSDHFYITMTSAELNLELARAEYYTTSIAKLKHRAEVSQDEMVGMMSHGLPVKMRIELLELKLTNIRQLAKYIPEREIFRLGVADLRALGIFKVSEGGFEPQDSIF